MAEFLWGVSIVTAGRIADTNTNFWDPLGFTADGDLLAFKRRRCVELKHGRISMLATMGYMTPEITGK